jgi:hypothetical protein
MATLAISYTHQQRSKHLPSSPTLKKTHTPQSQQEPTKINKSPHTKTPKATP